MKQQNSDFKFEELFIGKGLINLKTNQTSVIIKMTENSVEIWNAADEKYKDSTGKKTGIDSTNWYTLDLLNRKFRKLTPQEIENELMNSIKWKNENK